MLSDRAELAASKSPWVSPRRLAIPWSSGTLPPLTLLVPAVAVAILLLVPIAYLIMRATDGGHAIPRDLLRQRTLDILINTTVLAGAVAATTAILAVPLAWLTATTDLPARRFWAIVLPLPLVIPSYVGALTIIAAMSPRGMVQQWLEGPFGIERLPPIYGFLGSWWALTLFTYPYVYLGVRAAIRGLDPGPEEAARTLGFGPAAILVRVLLPQLRPAIAAGALLTALYTVSDFGVVSLMRYDAFTRAIYVRYQSSFDRSAAAALAIVLIVLTVAILLFESWVRGKTRVARVSIGVARTRRDAPLGRWRWVAFGFCMVVVFASLVLPLGVLVVWMLRGASSGVEIERLATQTLNSLRMAGMGGVVVVALAAPAAILSVRHRSRLTTLIEREAYLGYALPGVAVALAFVYLGARQVPFLYQTIWLLVIGYAVRFLPQALGAERISLLQVNPRTEEASRTLGAGFLSTIWRVTVPQLRPGLMAGFGLVALTIMKELPITMMLAPIEFETLATGIWQATQTGAYGRAAVPATVIILVSAVPGLLLSRRGMGEVS